MSTFSWRNARLNREAIPVDVSGCQLTLHRFFSNAEGIPVFMVHDRGESAEVYAPGDSDSGLAPFLADLGFDVYVAELRFDPELLNDNNKWQNLGLHNLILEDLPAHLSAIAKMRPGQPQFWVGHGLANVLMLACYARLDLLPAPILGMVQFGASRRCELLSLPKSLSLMVWRLKNTLASVDWLPGKTQSRKQLADMDRWFSMASWIDPVDQFDYREALEAKQMPPCLYFSLARTSLWGGVADARLWIRELGDHDAQLISLGRKNGNLRQYSQETMLTASEACEDHFLDLQQWMDHRKGALLEPARQRA